MSKKDKHRATGVLIAFIEVVCFAGILVASLFYLAGLV